MKALVQTLSTPCTLEKPWLAVWADLVKLRLTVMVLLTTLVGFHLGSREGLEVTLLLHTLMGTALLAGGAAALNQLLEREFDARMERTADRPLPAGRLQPQTVLIAGVLAAVAGLVQVAAMVNLLTALLGAVTLAIYLFLYTPLKRVTWLNTLVGAIPGALPPLIGWAAARGELAGGGSLFAILFFWQIAHFLAISWIYRAQYAEAGFVMLPNVDPQGARTARQARLSSALLVAASLGPALAGLTSSTGYVLGAGVLGAVFLGAAASFSRQLDIPAARRLFLASILYLPLLLSLMVIDRRAF